MWVGGVLWVKELWVKGRVVVIRLGLVSCNSNIRVRVFGVWSGHEAFLFPLLSFSSMGAAKSMA